MKDLKRVLNTKCVLQNICAHTCTNMKDHILHTGSENELVDPKATLSHPEPKAYNSTGNSSLVCSTIIVGI